MNASVQRRLGMRQRGFTLIEMMAALALVAVILYVALPGFRALIYGMRASAEANAVVSTIRFARTEAVKRGTVVSIAPASGSTSLSQGWVVFTDPTNSRDVTTAGVNKLAVRDDVAGDMIITTHGACAAASPANANLSMNRFGNCGDDSVPAMRVMVGVADASGSAIDKKYRRAVCLSPAGRVEVRNPAAAVLDANACD
jgi:prepilin-type N-terminal cleavage/methylation domain-containing protein